MKGYKGFCIDSGGYYTKPADKKHYFEEGKTYEVEHLELCKSGFHFVKFLGNLWDYCPLMSFNKIAEIETLGDVVHVDLNYATDKIKILRFLTSMEIFNILEGEVCSISNSEGVSDSAVVQNSDGVRSSSRIQLSDGICDSADIYASDGIESSSSISHSRGLSATHTSVSTSGAVDSFELYYCSGITKSLNCSFSDSICSSYGIYRSKGVNYSTGIYDCVSVENCYGLRNCRSIADCMFCYGLSCKRFYVFNKPVGEQRFKEIYETFGKLSKRFVPKFSILNSKSNSISLHKMSEEFNPDAWSGINVLAMDYLKSILEFDLEIFNKIIKY